MRWRGRPRWLSVCLTAALVAVAAGLTMPKSVEAAAKTWTGAGADGNWATPANWNPAGAPVNGDALTFPCGAPRPANTNNAVTSVASITFSGSTCAYIIGGNALSTAVAGTVTDGAASGTNSITLALTGAYSVAKTGAGTLALSGANGYTGGTSLTGGTLVVGGNTALGTAALTAAGAGIRAATAQSLANAINLSGPLTTNGPAGTTLTLNGLVSGAGSLIQSGDNTVVLGHPANTFTGGTSLQAGTLTLGAPGSLGSGTLTFVAGTLQASVAMTIANAVTISGTGTVAGSMDITFSAAITGPGGLVQTDTATVVMGATESYGGATIVNAGTLRQGVSQNLHATTVGPLGTLDLNGLPISLGSLSGAGSVTLGAGALTVGADGGSPPAFTGTLSGTGALNKVGSGTMTLAGACCGAYTGPTSVTSGILAVGDGVNLRATSMSSGATLAVLASANATLLSLAGAGSLTLGASANLSLGGDAGATTFSGVISGPSGSALTLLGPGTLTLSGNSSSFTGSTAIVGGALVVTGRLSPSLVSVTNLATLAGNPPQPGGEVFNVSSGGTVQPGFSGRAILNCTDVVTMSGSSNLTIEIDGPVAGTGFDQLNCTTAAGRVNLVSATLVLRAPNPVAPGAYPIVHAQGGIFGTFQGLPNGQTLTVNGQLFYITYTATDVILTRATGSRYVPMAPYRLLDTRQTGQRLGPGGTLDLKVLGTGVPGSGVSAVVVNVTAVSPSASSYLTIYPTGASVRPLASNLNFATSQTIANLVTVAIGQGGSISVYNSEGSVDVLVDVQGWYTAAPEGSNAGLFKALPIPQRIIDTRPDSKIGPYSTPIPPGGIITIQVGNQSGVPASAVAAVLNVTPVNGSMPSYLTVYPADAATKPVVSNVNFPAGRNLPNRVMVKLGAAPAAGQVDIYNSEGYVDVVVDLAGWFTDSSDPSGALFHAIAPARVLDTRNGTGGPSQPLGANSSIAAAIVGSLAGVPPGAIAMVGNATVTNPTAGSFLTLYPSGQVPNISDLNYGPGDTLPNLVVTRIGGDGKIGIYNNLGSVDVILDISGWYS